MTQSIQLRTPSPSSGSKPLRVPNLPSANHIRCKTFPWLALICRRPNRKDMAENMKNMTRNAGKIIFLKMFGSTKKRIIGNIGKKSSESRAKRHIFGVGGTGREALEIWVHCARDFVAHWTARIRFRGGKNNSEKSENSSENWNTLFKIMFCTVGSKILPSVTADLD